MEPAAPHAEKSTTVRLGTRERALRAGVGALGAVAPALAARALTRLFLTPPRTPPPARERAALARADRFGIEVGGRTLRGFRLGEGPAVLLVHGWGGRAGQLAAFAGPLAAAGCAVVGFDAPAHGASSGRVATVPEVAAAIAAVARAHGARAAIGHSMGGAAVAYALSRGLALDAAVLVAAPRAPAGYFDRFCAALDLRPSMREAARRRIERRVGARMADLDVVAAAPALATPALVVHDRGDGEVPFADGAAIAAAWPGARLLATDGLGHRRLLRDPAVVAEAVAFVVARLPRCGCGRLARARAAGAPRCAGCLLDLHLRDREARAAGCG
jgi:pimeloyl-ACP methyl ester carboxylesterase